MTSLVRGFARLLCRKGSCPARQGQPRLSPVGFILQSRAPSLPVRILCHIPTRRRGAQSVKTVICPMQAQPGIHWSPEPMLLTPESSPGCNTEHCGGRQQAQIDRLLDPPAGDEHLTRRNLRGTGRYMFPPPLASLSGFRDPVGISARRVTPQRPSTVDAERWLRAPASPPRVRSRPTWRPTRPG